MCIRDREWVVTAIVEALDDWGYRGEELILRSDQEGAIEVVKRKVAEYRVGRTMPEESPVGESSANGRVEEAGKRVRDQARVLKDQVEYRSRGKMDMEGDVMQWLVRWAAMVQTRFKEGKDGRTPWERMRGRDVTWRWYRLGRGCGIRD